MTFGNYIGFPSNPEKFNKIFGKIPPLVRLNSFAAPARGDVERPRARAVPRQRQLRREARPDQRSELGRPPVKPRFFGIGYPLRS